MTRIEQQNNSYWLSAFALGTVFNILLFVLLPTLGHSEKIPQPMVIALDFVAWQEPVKQKKVVTPTPREKPPIKQPIKPKLKPKPKQERKIELQKPKPLKKPVLTESVELPKEQTPPQIEQPVEEPQETVLPEPVPIFQVTNLPRVVHWERPEYPPQMKLLGREATVKVEALIDKTGKIRQVVVVKSGGADFDVAAIAAIGRSSFLPANIDGRPVPVRYRIPIRFKLN